MRNERRETHVNTAPTRAIVSSEPQLRRKGLLARGRSGAREGIGEGAPNQPRHGWRMGMSWRRTLAGVDR